MTLEQTIAEMILGTDDGVGDGPIASCMFHGGTYPEPYGCVTTISEYLFGEEPLFPPHLIRGNLTGVGGRTVITGLGLGALIGTGATVDVDPDLIPSPTEDDVGKVLRVGPDMKNIWDTEEGMGYRQDFEISDWVQLGLQYYTITVTHNLSTLSPQVELYQEGFIVIIDQVEIVNENIIKLYVLYNPDCRFNGSIVISK
jgi:hypothetical protein